MTVGEVYVAVVVVVNTLLAGRGENAKNFLGTVEDMGVILK